MNTILYLTLLTSGTVSYYDPTLMEAVYSNRLAMNQVAPCPNCLGYAALIEPYHIGDKIYIDWGTVIDGPYLVVDCAMAQHKEYLNSINRVVEVDWLTAQRHNITKPVNVRVYKVNYSKEFME